MDPSGIACPRVGCPSYGEVGKGNVRIHTRYGSQDWALLWCRSCRRTFSERRWTPFFRLQIPSSKVLEIFRLLSEGLGVRAAARKAGVDKNTVLKMLDTAERHVRWFQLSLVRDYSWEPHSADRFYAFIKQRSRAKALRGDDGRAGRRPSTSVAASY